ncbi:MAG TPA: putative peptidoglycan glycosyltransferase FtsW [Streptosporangiaceae bacterium]|nr:putative peptidoglycan glycosyltransferase FtsW [Streptosporangiaceae bacterium]
MSPNWPSTEWTASEQAGLPADGLAGAGRRGGPGAAVAEARERAARLRDGALGLKALLDRPLASYYLVLGCTLLLLAVGLMMVLSTSTAYDLDNGAPPYSMFEKQALGAVAGLVIMWLAAKAPPRVFRLFAYPLLLASLLGLVLVLLFGPEVQGVQRWLIVGGNEVQPSEFAKLALVVWGADLLARKDRLGQLTDWRHLLVPLLPGAALMCLLVMIGKDLGTTFLLLVIFMALLWIIGAPARLLIGLLALLVFALAMLVAVHSYEWTRLVGFVSSQSSANCASMSCYQLTQGKDALGSGGWFGVGLGASTAKWGYLPLAYADFIFADLGEELGLVGAICIIVLYGALAFAGLRIARRVPDTFSRLAAGSITVWLITQAVVNIGAVLGLLPITGVPLPLISAGVSSLIATLAALGMLLSFARTEPGAARALAAAGPGLPRRLLGWLGIARRLS